MAGLQSCATIPIKCPKSVVQKLPYSVPTGCREHGLADTHRGIVPVKVRAVVGGDGLLHRDDGGAGFGDVEAFGAIRAGSEIVGATSYERHCVPGVGVVPVGA